MSSWKDQPWAKEPAVLITELDRLYAKAVGAGKIVSPAHSTMEKVMAIREWSPAVPMAQLLQAIQTLGILYIPAGMPPGPGIMFPITDVDGKVKRLQIRLNDPAAYGMRYMSIMDPDGFMGPGWVGSDRKTRENIIRTGNVLVVEGPFDLLAVRALAPDLPSLCPLSKRMSWKHVAFMLMYGVERLQILMDQDEPGRKATTDAEKNLGNKFKIVPVRCPAADPSDCLTSRSSLFQLQEVLRLHAPEVEIPWDDL